MPKEIEILRRVQSGPPTKEQVENWIDKPPALVLIDLSKKCNLWCDLHCGYPGQQERREDNEAQGKYNEPVFIDVRHLKRAYQEIASVWLPTKPGLQISADGEPLLHPGAIEAICYPAKELGLDVGLTTNGTLLTRSKAEIMCLSGVSLINISLDAASPETYGIVRPERQRRVNYFSVVVSNIEEAVKVRNRLAESQVIKTQFMITMIVRKETAHEEEAFIELGKRLGVDKVSYRPLNTTAGLTPFTAGNAHGVELDNQGVVIQVDGITRHPCHFPFTRFSLTVAEEGLKFVYCPHAWDRSDADIGVYPSDGSIKDLWKSARLEEIREAHLKNKFLPGSLCANCADWRFVTGSDQITYADIIKDTEK